LIPSTSAVSFDNDRPEDNHRTRALHSSTTWTNVVGTTATRANIICPATARTDIFRSPAPGADVFGAATTRTDIFGTSATWTNIFRSAATCALGAGTAETSCDGTSRPTIGIDDYVLRRTWFDTLRYGHTVFLKFDLVLDQHAVSPYLA
jgi:hypothetical protein